MRQDNLRDLWDKYDTCQTLSDGDVLTLLATTRAGIEYLEGRGCRLSIVGARSDLESLKRMAIARNLKWRPENV